jgi:hypothetical protein
MTMKSYIMGPTGPLFGLSTICILVIAERYPLSSLFIINLTPEQLGVSDYQDVSSRASRSPSGCWHDKCCTWWEARCEARYVSSAYKFFCVPSNMAETLASLGYLLTVMLP